MLENGLVAIVKRDCPTCVMVAPVLQQLREQGELTVYSQDDPSFPECIDGVTDDTALDASYRLDVEIVPTLVRSRGGGGGRERQSRRQKHQHAFSDYSCCHGRARCSYPLCPTGTKFIRSQSYPLSSRRGADIFHWPSGYFT